MKGNITAIRQVLNEDLTLNCYEIMVDVIEQPDLIMGNCEIVQMKGKEE